MILYFFTKAKNIFKILYPVVSENIFLKTLLANISQSAIN